MYNRQPFSYLLANIDAFASSLASAWSQLLLSETDNSFSLGKLLPVSTMAFECFLLT